MGEKHQTQNQQANKQTENPYLKDLLTSAK